MININPTKKLRTFVYLLTLIGLYSLKAQNFQWAKQISGTSAQTITGSAIDANGNLFICGKHTGTMDADPGPDVLSYNGSGFYFSKFDEGGNLLWSKRIPAGGFLREITGITYSATDNSITIVGSFDVSTATSLDFDPGTGTAYAPVVPNNSTFIAKYSAADGTYQWVKFINEGSGNSGYLVIPNCVTSDASGNIYVGGNFYSVAGGLVDFDPGAGIQNLTAGAQDGYVLKLNASGNFQNVFQFGSPVQNDEVTSIAVDASGNIYVTGSGAQSLDMDPTAGTTTIPAGGGGRDGYLTKLTSVGAFSWAKYFISTGNDLPMCVKISNSGIIHLTGSYAAALKINNTTTNDLPAPTGTSDLFLIGYNAAGTLQFSSNSAVAGDERGLDIAFEAGTGGTTVVGISTVSAINSALIYKYTTAGAFSSASNISDATNMTATCVEAYDSDVIVCGNFSATADFNPGAATFNMSCTTPTDAYMRKTKNGSCVTATLTSITSSSSVVCQGGSVMLSVNGNINNNNLWQWRTGSCTGPIIDTGATITVSPSAATTYYVKAIDGCATASSCVALTLGIQALPTITATLPGFTCGTGAVSIVATPSSSASVQWFDASTGGSVISTGSTYNTPSINANTTYYAGAIINGCVSSSRTAVVASYYPMPTISVTPTSRCGAGSGTLTATPSSGASIKWYDASNSFLASGTSYTTSCTATTTFKAEASTANCTSAKTNVIFTVNPIPTITSTVPTERCGSGTATVSATPSAGSIDWFAASSGGATFFTGNNYTASISSTITLYAQATDGPCTSANRTPVTITIKPNPSIGVTLSGNTITAAEPNASATFQWFDCNTTQPLAGALARNFTPTTSGSFQASITLNGCTATSACTNVTITALNTSQSSGIFTFENPIQDEIKINTDRIITNVKIISVDGHVLIEQNSSSGIRTIDTKGLQQGIHTLLISTENHTEGFRIVKQ